MLGNRRSTGSTFLKGACSAGRKRRARTIALPVHLCSLAPRARGGFIGAGYDAFVEIAADLRISPLADPQPGGPANRFNDGKTDRAGRFWAGTMDRSEREASGSLYRLGA